MDTKEVVLFVYDTRENFEGSRHLLGDEGIVFKKIVCIQSLSDLENHLRSEDISGDDYLFLAVHVFAHEKIQGIKKFLASKIQETYPALNFMYISEGGIEADIHHQMVDNKIPTKEIYKYHHVFSNLHDDKVVANKKRDVIRKPNVKNSLAQSTYPKIKYAVITALFKDEFEQLQRVFDFPEDKQIHTAKKIFYRGYLKTDTNIEIIAAIPNSTGMVDSSIIATQLLELFRPDYLLMSGVCGGASDRSYGDIIVAKQVFTFQKGKISDVKVKNSEGKYVPIDLYDKNGQPVDYNSLYDSAGKQVSVSVEKFEIEHDSIISLDSRFEDSLNPKLELIKDRINKSINEHGFHSSNKTIDIVLEPMACSTMVINKDGYFEDTVRPIHRKTSAIEMESYGVARACQFANEGKTIAIIFKSVMDYTVNKIDAGNGMNFKKFAAYTSAQFMRSLFEERVI